MLEERCLFLLALKKEQAIDEYYRQVGGGWLFLWHFRGNINFLPRRAFLGGAVTDFLPILSHKGTIISMEERSGARECNG
ncbi:MAG TPA: hypothetical protein DEO38_00715 [Bacteroidales bacterium]|nr:hypothetical protein [Bacteroidales bacterium]